MRSFTIGVLTLALAFVATGCGSMQFNMSEPQAAQLSFKNYYVLWESWGSKSVPLPATVTLSAHSTKLIRVTNIPQREGLTVYGKITTYGNTTFSKFGQIPLVINAQDVDDVSRGNVVRIVIVDPKREHQTSRFVQLRLSPTEDAMKSAKEIGTPLALVILGNRAPKYVDFFATASARSTK